VIGRARVVFVVAACCSCGRIGFDVPGGGATDAAAIDADPNAPDADPTAPDARIDAGPGTYMEDFAAGQDSTVRDWRAADNYGSRPEIMVEAQGGQNQVALIQFNLDEIPQTAQVTQAEVHLFVSGSVPTTNVKAYVVNESWQEGTQDGNPGTCNWTERTEAASWTAQGVGPPSRDPVDVFGVDVSSATEYAIPISIDLVGAWVLDPKQNHGLALLTTSSNEVTFHSKEATVIDNRPFIRVRYTVF
jgi:hypothetical protein